MDNASDLDVLPTASIVASANATASAGTTHNITLSVARMIFIRITSR